MKSQAVFLLYKVIGAVLLTSLLLLSIGSDTAFASPNTPIVTVVEGNIVDTNGNKVSGAQGYVTCNGFTKSFSAEGGAYFVRFIKSECPHNSTVIVSASKGDMSGSVSQVVKSTDPAEVMTMNVTLMQNVAVPEFSTYTMTLAVAMCAGAYLIFRKRFI